ncbi:MAG TPA: bifunctional isocitrate dehydrogenase kinase/phosphatase [Chloroflexia bacterium]|nr:bifunctional isocitrate dehydrogenase kinase/phosphatase [Chloroflexia bacterium]
MGVMIQELDNPLVATCAAAIHAAFDGYHAAFKTITRQATPRFEQREWLLMHADAEDRLDLYKTYVDQTVADLQPDLAPRAADKAFWHAVKERYTEAVAGRPDFDLAESFYNSVTMRVVPRAGIDPTIEYVGTEFPAIAPAEIASVYTIYPVGDSPAALIRTLLLGCGFRCPYQDLARDTARVAAEIAHYLQGLSPALAMQRVELVRPVFFRGQGAYLVGRIYAGGRQVPLVLALLNGAQGIYVDAVLLTEDEVSIIFSFARSYFHVEVAKPYALVLFLKSIMPLKRIAELYISLGYNKHGKTELYRDLVRHLERSTDTFQIAPGARGMVMVVFALPSYDVVFKVIKDSFDYPKTTTRREVMSRYQLVFKHDRGGRLVDAQEFEHLWFAKDRFAPELLAELADVASHSVSVHGDYVVIKHLYTERRLTPLNLYFQQVDGARAAEVVIDYGQAIKDLAATNIFPGDILLKNFGVTRHGRVVFYDYDELCLLTDCQFREMPQATDSDEDVAAEPWFFVGENDVFPEELATFLGLPPPLHAIFTAHHGDLFEVAFWAAMRARHLAHEVIDILPYKESRRLAAGEA